MSTTEEQDLQLKQYFFSLTKEQQAEAWPSISQPQREKIYIWAEEIKQEKLRNQNGTAQPQQQPQAEAQNPEAEPEKTPKKSKRSKESQEMQPKQADSKPLSYRSQAGGAGSIEFGSPSSGSEKERPQDHEKRGFGSCLQKD